jgi:hypothetical protein
MPANSITQSLRALSEQDFAVFGVNHIAYVKPMVVQDALVYAVHAADGTPLTVLSERDVADATVRQNDMEPFSVH